MVALALLSGSSTAFTLQMTHQHSNRRIVSNTITNRIPPPPISTSNGAMATDCHGYAEPSFKSRVGIALGGIKQRIRRRRPQVEVVEDVSDFDGILKRTKEQFVAVFFHSPVCKACQAAAPHYYKLSQKYSNVKFLSVPLTPGNKQTLQQDMGVKKFPFGHIYHSQHGLLDELPVLRKLIPHFEERLQTHVALSTRSALQEGLQEYEDSSFMVEGCGE